MKNEHLWKPSKYVSRDGRLHASCDPAEVAVASRLTVDIVARYYSQYVPLYCRGRVADLGCGKVPLYGLYRKYATEVTCVDWPLSLHECQYVDVECDLSGELPFEEGQFETLLVSDVLEHLPEPLFFWKEMHRILAVGGHILLNVPFLYWLHETPHDYYRYTAFGLRYLAEKAGCKVLVLEPVGGGPAVLLDLFSKMLARQKIPGSLLARFFQSMSLRVSHRSFWGKNKHLFPLGYFMVCTKELPDDRIRPQSADETGFSGAGD